MELVSPETLGFSSARLGRIRPVLQRYIDEGKLAGFLTLAARRGQVVHLEKVGMQDIASGKPMAEDTLFRIYSMTKPVTSAAVMLLVEEGLLHLFDPIEKYLPWFKDTPVMVSRPNRPDYDLVPKVRSITVRDLLTHTAGLSYGAEPNSPLDDLYRAKIFARLEKEPVPDPEEIFQEIAKLPLAFQPGSAFRYSFATDVLGYLIQVISGKPFDTFLQERIFEPLGMSDTFFVVPPEKVSRFASLYGPNPAGGLMLIDNLHGIDFFKRDWFPSGGGGLVSSISDYFRFCQMMLNYGQLDGVRVLGRKTVEWMTMNHLQQGVYVDGDPSEGFGLGGLVVIDPGLYPTLSSYGTYSWSGAANTRFWIDYEEELVGILMTQLMPFGLYHASEDFVNLVYQALVD